MVKELPVNEKITAREVLVIGGAGERLGTMPLYRALEVARQQGLDLVQVAGQAVPPVCRLLDYGKYRYEQAKKERLARRQQHSPAVREVRFRPKIKDHDLEAKARLVERLLGEGDKVKVTVIFRGREATHPELGWKLLKKIAQSPEGSGKVEGGPVTEGGNLMVVFSPKRKEVKEVKARDAQT